MLLYVTSTFGITSTGNLGALLHGCMATHIFDYFHLEGY
jgi:hypothetical protein